jgi:hypothetical protein
MAEASMPFSLSSYLLGVGTVVGALTFGFGGGVFLTHTAMKDVPAGQTRVERVARADPEKPASPQTPVVQIAPAANHPPVEPDHVSTPDQDHPASIDVPKQDAVQEQPAAADASRRPEPETPREPPKQVQAARDPQPAKQAAKEAPSAKQVEQTERTEAKPVESRETDRGAERSRHYAERRPSDGGTVRASKRKPVDQDDVAQEVTVSRPPEQPHFDLFGGLFGRPADTNE